MCLLFFVVHFLALVELRHRRIVGCHRAFKQSTRPPPCFGRFHSVKTILNYFHLRYHSSQRDNNKSKTSVLLFLLSLRSKISDTQEPEPMAKGDWLVELMQHTKCVVDKLYCLYFKRYTLCVLYLLFSNNMV